MGEKKKERSKFGMVAFAVILVAIPVAVFMTGNGDALLTKVRTMLGW